MPVRRVISAILPVCVVLVVSANGPLAQNAASQQDRSAAKHQPAPQTPPLAFILVGAGDIASCKNLRGAEATAQLIEHFGANPDAAVPVIVFAAGDLAYESGTPAEFKNCYDPTWGRFKNRTFPAPGNHEYNGSPGTGYFQYWGVQAGEAGRGYYSYDLGDWHIIALNTNCASPPLGGCAPGSPQELWLRKDLAKYPHSCILAYGHHPLFSSGLIREHAVQPKLRPLWEVLYEAHADVVLAGHEHSYERFAPQNPNGHLDPANGIREIVVGTGGRGLWPLGGATPNSEYRNWNALGVLKLTLSRGKYKWEFVPVLPAPEGFLPDSGEGTCHNPPAP